MAIGTRDAVYYREIEFPIDINHKVESYEYSAKWRFEFYPAGGVIDENPINVEYNEFPPFIFMIEETGGTETEYLDGIPYGLRKAEEMTLTINLESFKGSWVGVRNYIISETLNLSTSPETVKFNQWKIWRQKLDGTFKLYFWGCQTGMGGYPEWGIEGTKTYEIKAMDVFRAISGKVTTVKLISDIFETATFTETSELAQNYANTQAKRCRHNGYGSVTYNSLTNRQILSQIIASLNERAKWPLSITSNIFSTDYEFPFVIFYKQLLNGSMAKGAAIDFLDLHRICFLERDGRRSDGLFYNEKGWLKKPTVWDLLNDTSKGLFSKLDYDVDETNNGIKMAFFNCMSQTDYDRATPEPTLINIDNGFVKSEKLKQRSKIFGASLAHFMDAGENDLKALALNNANYIMISESLEEELEFNTNKMVSYWNEQDKIYNFKSVPIFGLFEYIFTEETGYPILLSVHDYCEIDSGYSSKVAPATEYDTYTNWSDISGTENYNAYIRSRQFVSGLGYVWCYANNLAFSGQNQATIPITHKIISINDFIKLGQKYTFDINAKFGLTDFAQFNSQVFIIKKKTNFFKLNNEIEILIRGDL